MISGDSTSKDETFKITSIDDMLDDAARAERFRKIKIFKRVSAGVLLLASALGIASYVTIFQPRIESLNEYKNIVSLVNQGKLEQADKKSEELQKKTDKFFYKSIHKKIQKYDDQTIDLLLLKKRFKNSLPRYHKTFVNIKNYTDFINADKALLLFEDLWEELKQYDFNESTPLKNKLKEHYNEKLKQSYFEWVKDYNSKAKLFVTDYNKQKDFSYPIGLTKEEKDCCEKWNNFYCSRMSTIGIGVGITINLFNPRQSLHRKARKDFYELKNLFSSTESYPDSLKVFKKLNEHYIDLNASLCYDILRIIADMTDNLYIFNMKKHRRRLEYLKSSYARSYQNTVFEETKNFTKSINKRVKESLDDIIK